MTEFTIELFNYYKTKYAFDFRILQIYWHVEHYFSKSRCLFRYNKLQQNMVIEIFFLRFKINK